MGPPYLAQESQKLLNMMNNVHTMYIQVGQIEIKPPVMSDDLVKELQQGYDDMVYMAKKYLDFEATLSEFYQRILSLKQQNRLYESDVKQTIERKLRGFKSTIQEKTDETDSRYVKISQLLNRANKSLGTADQLISDNAAMLKQKMDSIMDVEDVYKQELDKEPDVLKSLEGGEQKKAALDEQYNLLRKHLEDLRNKNEEYERTATNIRSSLDSLQTAYDDLTHRTSVMNSIYDQTVRLLRADGKGAETEIVEACAPNGQIDITVQSCSKIFEMPTEDMPALDLSGFSSYEQVQAFVASTYKTLAWRTPAAKGFDCPKPGQRGVLNSAQKLVYHYMHPYPFTSPDLNLLLYHSAGSGKTASLMMVASLFNRAGYSTLIVTKKSLVGGYLASAFEEQADINIQHYLAAKNVQTIRELIAKENKVTENDVSKEDVWDRGKGIWSEMGIKWNDKHQVITYEQLTNSAQGGGQERMKYLMGLVADRDRSGKKAHEDDPMAKMICLIDEVQKLSGISPELAPRAMGMITILHEMFWKSREMSGPEAGRVVCASATPVMDSALDGALILNLLVPREQAMELVQPGDNFATWPEAKEVLQRRFSAKYLDRAGNLTRAAEAKMRDMAKGRISYLDLVGDKTHFATKKVHIPKIYFSQAQEKSIAECFKRNASLEYDRDSRRWIRRKKDPVAEKPQKSTREWLLEDPTQGPGDDEDFLHEDVDAAKLKECVMRSHIFPANDTSRTVQQMVKSERVLNMSQIKMYSPLLEEVLSAVQKDYVESTKNVFGTGAPRALKQFIFCDLSLTADSDNYGVNLIAAVLRSAGYQSITRDVKYGDVNGVEMLAPEELDKIPKHKRMLVLNRRSLPSGGSQTRSSTTLERLLRYFNDPENTDGRNCSIILLDGQYKEGISLTDIGYVYIVGFMNSQGDLVQATARAFRNCKSTNIPWKEREGAVVTVRIICPTFEKTSQYAKAKTSIRELLKKMTPDGSAAMEAVMTLFQEVAYDKNLLTEINDASRDETDKLMLT